MWILPLNKCKCTSSLPPCTLGGIICDLPPSPRLRAGEVEAVKVVVHHLKWIFKGKRAKNPTLHFQISQKNI